MAGASRPPTETGCLPETRRLLNSATQAMPGAIRPDQPYPHPGPVITGVHDDVP